MLEMCGALCRWYTCCWTVEYASSLVPQRTLLLAQKSVFLLAMIIADGTSSASVSLC